MRGDAAVPCPGCPEGTSPLDQSHSGFRRRASLAIPGHRESQSNPVTIGTQWPLVSERGRQSVRQEMPPPARADLLRCRAFSTAAGFPSVSGAGSRCGPRVRTGFVGRASPNIHSSCDLATSSPHWRTLCRRCRIPNRFRAGRAASGQSCQGKETIHPRPSSCKPTWTARSPSQRLGELGEWTPFSFPTRSGR